jgi:hypothetical protein
MKFLIVVALSILIFLGFVTWIGYSTKEPSQKNTNQIQTTATSNKYDYPAFKAALGAGFVKIKGYVHEFHEDIIAVGTVFIALFTTILAFATGFLYVATRALVVGAKDTAKRQLRAYIAGPTKARIRLFQTANPASYLEFQNSGQTPAHDVRLWTSSAVTIYPLQKPPAGPQGDISERESSTVGVVGPNGVFHTECTVDIPITAEEREAVIKGTGAFFIYGELFYRDSFGENRKTSFCHYLRGDKARATSADLPSYHKWNEAT